MRFLILCAPLVLAVAAQAAPTTQTNAWVPGNTYPSEYQTNLRFQLPGLVEKVYVKPGQTVKPGQELMKLDTRLEEQELKVLEVDTSDLPIDASRKELEVKRTEFDVQDEALKRGATTPSEWRKAKAEFELAELRLEKAKLDKKQAEIKVARQQEKIRQMTLLSQAEGVIEKIDVHAGETADPGKPVLTIAVNAPLWIETRLPTEQAQMLQVGQELKVRYEKESPDAARPAKVIYRAPFADTRADRQLIRLEWDNPKNRDAGLRVLIELPREVADALNKPERSAVSGM